MVEAKYNEKMRRVGRICPSNEIFALVSVMLNKENEFQVAKISKREFDVRNLHVKYGF
jgi:hypothetical protein